MLTNNKQKAAGPFASFLKDRSGTTGVIFGLAFIPVMSFMGAAIDFRNATVTKSRLQSAVDAAVIAVVNQSRNNYNVTESSRQARAQNVVDARMNSAAAGNVTVTATRNAMGVVEVRATTAVPTVMLRFARFDSIPVTATAKAADGIAVIQGAGAGCVLSLNESAVEALDWSGNADVTLKNCDIYGNSGASYALDVGGSAKLKVDTVRVHGGIRVQGSGILESQRRLTNQPRLPDPYESVALPEIGACSHDGFSTNEGGELEPGVYCNGFAINTNSDNKGEVKLKPGLYVIDGGQFFINGQAKVRGQGVTLVFSRKNGSSWPSVRINGGADIRLEAPKKDDPFGMPGMVMYGDRSMPVGTEFKLNGGASQEFKGAVYLPEAKLTFNGGTDTTGLCMQLIADTVTFTGNATVGIEGCGEFGLKSLGYTIARTAHIVQ